MILSEPVYPNRLEYGQGVTGAARTEIQAPPLLYGNAAGLFLCGQTVAAFAAEAAG